MDMSQKIVWNGYSTLVGAVAALRQVIARGRARTRA